MEESPAAVGQGGQSEFGEQAATVNQTKEALEAEEQDESPTDLPSPPPSNNFLVEDSENGEQQGRGHQKAQRRVSKSIKLGNTGAIEFNIDLDKAAQYQARVPINWNIKRTANKPCSCCCQMCGLWILSIVVFAVLTLTVGPVVFNLDVPFYDRSELNQERQDSIFAGRRDADFVAKFGQGQEASNSSGVCRHENPTILLRDGTLERGPPPSSSCQRASTQRLRVLFVSKDRKSNIFTPSNLQGILEIEDRILSEANLPRYCQLQDSPLTVFPDDPNEWAGILEDSVNQPAIYTPCKRVTSPLNFIDDRFFDYYNESGLGYYLITEDIVKPLYDFSEENLESVLRYWSEYGAPRTYDLTDFDAAVQTIGKSVTVRNLFYEVASSDFTVGSTSVIGLAMMYDLGQPINGYESASQDTSDQYEETGQWLWDQFNSYLKSASFDGVDVYFSDTQDGMLTAESGYSAVQSFALFPFSVIFVLLYLIYMQDSIFVGCVGIMQILLSFIPGITLYRYVFGTTYIGVLNLISIYIILGIGVDDIFVFCDQFQHHAHERSLDVRMQLTWAKASKALLVTSCTTFVSFISNASSVFPAVAAFGLFSAMMVLVKYFAVIIFFPAAYAVYWTRIRHLWYDRPSRLFCFMCKKDTPTPADSGDNGGDDNKKATEQDQEKGPYQEVEHHDTDESKLVAFFRDTWAPLVVKLRFLIILVFVGIMVVAGIFAGRLQPDEEAPQTLPKGNNYVEEPKILLQYFARAQNPRNIEVHWVSGIDPDIPIDRSGTDDTNTTDYGTTNFVDCSSYNPTTVQAQVFALNTCHDLYFGNVSALHGPVGTDGIDPFGVDGKNGPQSRKVVSDTVPMSEFNYYQMVTCWAQAMRDWLLTDNGCSLLTNLSLPCASETMQREGCAYWDTEGNSCEPYPVPEDLYLTIAAEMLMDDTASAGSGATIYDMYSDKILAALTQELDKTDAIQPYMACRASGNVTLLAVDNTATLQQDFAINYQDGLDLYGRWKAWSAQMRASVPLEMRATMQATTLAWAYYYLNETLLNETFASIALALGLSFLILTLVGGNPIMAFLSVFTIALIVVDVFAFTVMVGWKLGVLEAVNYVVVIGMSIDYCVHMSEAYTHANAETREERVRLMITDMAVSVLSGSLSTLGACFFMFFAPNSFFVKFASFMFVTMALSCIYALVFFPAMLAVVGPMNNFGDMYVYANKHWKAYIHKQVIAYLHSKDFFERERVEI